MTGQQRLSLLRPTTQEMNWKGLMAESFRHPRELLDHCDIDPGDLIWDLSVKQNFTFLVTRYFASLIEKCNPRDPLLLQVLPTAQESQKVSGYTRDAVGDGDAMPVPGLLHKYHGRVLLTLTGACAIHCRYCFRRHFPYREAVPDCSEGSKLMAYLSGHPEVTEVILSGGDPLILGDKKLGELITSLNSIPHIHTLRIHSRLLSVLPERVNGSFLEVIRRFTGQVVFVTHINHPNEISEANKAAFQRLSKNGYRLFNQSVLLRQVNDSVQTLFELSTKLFASQITPYYLHRLDKVQGAAHFDVTMEESCRIYTQLRNDLPGYLLPLMVEEIAGRTSKTPVICGDESPAR